jgi:hypothetical protein
VVGSESDQNGGVLVIEEVLTAHQRDRIVAGRSGDDRMAPADLDQILNPTELEPSAPVPLGVGKRRGELQMFRAPIGAVTITASAVSTV